MFCKKCGKPVDDDALFCPGCGMSLKSESKEFNNKDDEDKANTEKKLDKTKEKSSINSQNKSKKKVNKKILITCVISFTIIAIVCGVIVYTNQPSVKYKKASKAYKSGDYEKAIEIYTELGDYEDATELLDCAIVANCYVEAIELFDNAKYDEALSKFETIVEYEDSAEMINKCKYQKALICKEKGEYIDASVLFKESGYYEDSLNLIDEMGTSLTQEGMYADAISVFENSTTINNQYEKYASGMIDFENKNYSDASDNFKSAGDLYDSKEKYKESVYYDASTKFDAKNYEDAKVLFTRVGDYKDASDKVEVCSLIIAKELYDDGCLNQAKEMLEEIKEDTSYNGVSVESLLESINANEQWLNICGVWSCTGGQMETRQTGGYGYYNYWYLDFDENQYSINIKCVINEDGTITVKTSGSIPIYTNYSSISAYLTTSVKSLSHDETMTGMGTITLDNNTSMTISSSGVSVYYKKVDNTQDVYFTYTYTTDITYGNKKSDL